MTASQNVPAATPRAAGDWPGRAVAMAARPGRLLRRFRDWLDDVDAHIERQIGLDA